MAERLGALAGAGFPEFTVVSGLAPGIDAAAHRGALDGRGSTALAVMANSASQVYPPEHEDLAAQIRQTRVR